jgi:hypothetical protein
MLYYMSGSVYVYVCTCNECINMGQEKHINLILDCLRFKLIYLINSNNKILSAII